MDTDENIFLTCPHCGDLFITTEKTIACAIYRHAAYRENMIQINPHETKEECDRLFTNNLVFGCAKPFKVIKKENNGSTEYEAIACDYI